MALMMLVGFTSVGYALSPFQTVAGIGGPLPGASMSCSAVQVSSFTPTAVLAANSLREAFWITNVSTVSVSGSLKNAEVWVTTFTATLNTPDFGLIAGFPLTSQSYGVLVDSSTLHGSSTFSMTGGSVYQGAMFGVCNSPGGCRVQACEVNP